MRRIPFVIALALGAICAAPAAAQPVAEDSSSDVVAGYDGYDEEDYGDEEFCGGEESSYDDANFAFQEGDYEDARDILVTALRDEDLYGGRAYYLVLLGQAQLRLNETRHATVNFRRAIAADTEGTYSMGARIGLAVAHLRNGQRRRAQDEATTYSDEHCAPGERATLSCYVSFVVAATTAREDEARAKSQEGARRIRSEMDQYQLPALAYYDATFDVSAWLETPAEG